MPVCEVLLQLSQESSCQAHLRRKCEIRHLYVCSIHHVCTKERDHTKQGSKGEIQQDSLLYCHGNPTLMKSRKTIKYLKKKKRKKSVLWIPTGLRKDALMKRAWHFYHLMMPPNKATGAAFGKCWLKKHSIY